jgi:hypothetical protein
MNFIKLKSEIALWTLFFGITADFTLSLNYIFNVLCNLYFIDYTAKTYTCDYYHWKKDNGRYWNINLPGHILYTVAIEWNSWI